MTPPGRSLLGEGEGEAVGLVPCVGDAVGLSAGEGLGLPSGEGVGVTLGEGVGDPFFLPPLREGEGEPLGVGVTEGSGVCVGEAVGFGELPGFGLGLRDGVGVAEVFFFVVLDFFGALFRFFGAGVGWKMLLILSPNDCASAAGGAANANATPHASVTRSNRCWIALFNVRVPAESICSAECRRRNFRAGSSR